MATSNNDDTNAGNEPDPTSEFRAQWTPDRLSEIAPQYRSREEKQLFAQLAAIDLERRWELGQQSTAHDYARQYSTLRTSAGPPRELVRAEVLARQRAGQLDETELLRSYPNYERELREWFGGKADEPRVTRKLPLPPMRTDATERPTRVLAGPAPPADGPTAIVIVPSTKSNGQPPKLLLAVLGGFFLGGLFLGAIAWATRPVRIVEIPVKEPAGEPVQSKNSVVIQPKVEPKIPPIRGSDATSPVAYDALTRVDQIPLLNAAQAFQASSFDRNGGNADAGQFIRIEPDGTQVLLDAVGPGVVTRIWMTGEEPKLRKNTCRLQFHFDEEPKPRLDLSIEELFGGDGSKYPFVAPLSTIFASGRPGSDQEGPACNCYVPIPFKSRLKVTGKNVQFYQINYQKLPAGADVPSWTSQWADAQRANHDRAAEQFQQTGQDPKPAASDVRKSSDPGPIAPEQSRTISLSGCGVIDRIDVKVAEPLAENIRGLSLRITFDGASGPSVLAPLLDFFGSGTSTARFKSLMSGVDEDGCYAFWPMPFERAAKIEVVNETELPIQIDRFDVQWHPEKELPANAGYFHAAYRVNPDCALGRDFNSLRVRGRRGKLVGTNLSMQAIRNSPGIYFLEGDEKIFCDGEGWPSRWLGTGTEDYFNGAYFWNHPDKANMARPLGGLTFLDWEKRRVNAYRWHVPDSISFAQSIQVDFEHGGANEIATHYASVAYYYLDAPTSQPSLPTSSVRMPLLNEPPQYTNVRGCELDPYVRVGIGFLNPEAVANAEPTYAPGIIRHFRTTMRGDTPIEATFRAVGADEYSVVALLAAGPNFGKVQPRLDGDPIGDPIDLYAPEFVPLKSFPLGQRKLDVGRHALQFVPDKPNELSKGAEFAFVGMVLSPMSKFVDKWNVVGTWPCPQEEKWKTRFPPELDPRPDAKYEGPLKSELTWKQVNDSTIPFSGDWQTGYGLTFVWSPDDREVGCFIAKDDSLKMWIDDQVVFDFWGHSDPVDDTSVLTVRLKKGWNRVLVKCTNWNGGCGFKVRFSDPDNKLEYAFRPMK